MGYRAGEGSGICSVLGIGAFLAIPIALSPLLETFSNSRGVQETLKPHPPGLGLWLLGQQQPLSPLAHPTQLSPFLGKLWLVRNLQCSSSSRMGGLSHWTAEKIYEVHKWNSLERAQEWFDLCPRSFIHGNAGPWSQRGEQCLPWCHQHFAPPSK